MTGFAVVSLGCGAVAALAAGPVLLRLPEPSDDPDAADKPRYAALPTPRFGLALAAAVAAASLVVTLTLPPAEWPAWLWLAGCGGLAVAVDAATTWLPRRLTLALQLGVALGLIATAAWTAHPGQLLAAGLGALLVRAFFFLFALPRNGIGFGDVELMTAVGAVVAAHSLALTWWALLLGCAAGALWGVGRRLLGRRGIFAFGPALWVGPFVALALTAAPGIG